MRKVLCALTVYLLLLSVCRVDAQMTVVRAPLYPAAGGGPAGFGAAQITSCLASACDAGGSTTLTASLTVPAGSNRGLVVGIGLAENGAVAVPAVSSVTCEGTQSLTQKKHTESGVGFYYIDVWTKDGYQPSTGAISCVVVLGGAGLPGGGSRLNVGLVSTTGTNASTTLYAGTGSGAIGTGTAANFTLTANNANNLGIDFVCGGTDGSFSPGSGITSQAYSGSNLNACGSFEVGTATGSTTALNWTIPSDSWINIGVQVQP